MVQNSWRGKGIAAVMTGMLSFMIFSLSIVYGLSEAESKARQLQDKIGQVQSLHDQVQATQSALSQAAAKLEAARQHLQDSKDICDKAKAKYDKAAGNADVTSAAVLAKLLEEYQTAKQVRDSAEAAFKAAENENSGCQDKLQRLKSEQQQTEAEILQLKADLFDLKVQEPVWAEGYSEAVQSEDQTPLQCREKALAIARQDALERGGKALIESVSEVKNFQLVRDEVKISGNAQIVEQDDSDAYGKIKKVIDGDVTKYVVTVRVKIVGVNVPNPFRNNYVRSNDKKYEVNGVKGKEEPKRGIYGLVGDLDLLLQIHPDYITSREQSKKEAEELQKVFDQNSSSMNEQQKSNYYNQLNKLLEYKNQELFNTLKEKVNKVISDVVKEKGLLGVALDDDEVSAGNNYIWIDYSVRKKIMNNITEENFSAKQWLAKGFILAEEGNYGDAIQAFDKAIALDSQLVSAYCNRGYCYNIKGMYESAISSLNKAISLNPHNHAYVYLSFAYSQTGQMNLAEEAFSKALALDASAAYNTRSDIYGAVGNYAKAIADAKMAIKLGYNDAYVNLAQALELSGDKTGALAAYRQVQKVSLKLSEETSEKVLARINGDWVNFKRWI